MHSIQTYSVLALDYRILLRFPGAEAHTPLSPSVARSIHSSSAWARYECGKIQRPDLCICLAKELSLPYAYLEEVLSHQFDLMQPDAEVISFICDLKNKRGEDLRLVLMSNLSPIDSTAVVSKLNKFIVFDDVLTSATTGMRKPDLGFYRTAIEILCLEPRATIIVEDNVESIISAQSLGIHGLLYLGCHTLRKSLCSIFFDPIVRAQAYLTSHSGDLKSLTNTGVIISDNFAQLLILEATNDRYMTNF